MIRDDAALAPLLAALERAPEVSLDTEFHGERHYYPRLMLVQVQVGAGPAYLVDPLAQVDMDALARAMERVPVVVVHGGVGDVQILHRLTGFRPREVFDTQIAAGCAGDGWPIRLQELVKRHLGEALPKTETLSDWSRRPLSEAQERYAEDDVRVLGPLATALRARLDALGNADLARECAAETYAAALAPPDDDGAWRTVPGAHLLDDAERPVLQALAAWRERTARSRDVPRPNVISDAILLDLARRRPDSVDAMRVNRRIPSNVWKRDADEVLAIVARARLAPPPPPLRPYPRVFAETVVTAMRLNEGDRSVAAELVADDSFIKRLFSGEKPEGWRARALGAGALAFLSGRAYIRFPPAFTS